MQETKTRSQIAHEYGISRWTLGRWLKRAGIKLSSGGVTPKEQELIYQTFGELQKPPKKNG